MASNSSWVPDESSQTLFDERCWLQGVVISAIAYGVTVSLYFLSFYVLVREKNRVKFRKRLPLLAYITVSFLLGTIFMISLAASTQMAFIDNRNYPGGPNAYEINMFSITISDIATIAFTLSSWLSDALVVWRFKVIYQRCRVPLWIVMLFPCLLLAALVAIGIMLIFQFSTTNPYVTKGINYTLPYFSLSLALNIILTIAIVLRLMILRCRTATALGPQHGTRYTSIATMMIESAALYSAVSITFLVLFGIRNAASELFLQSLNQFQTIAGLLIVFRVAQGKGWMDDTATYVMSVRGSNTSDSAKTRLASPGVPVTFGSSVCADHRSKTTGGDSQDSPQIWSSYPDVFLGDEPEAGMPSKA